MPRLAVHDPKGSCTPKRPAPSLCTARVYGGRIPRSLVHTRSRAARQRPMQGGGLHHRAFCVNFWIESLPGSGYVLTVTSAQPLGLRPVADWAKEVSEGGWTRLSAGDGAKGPRLYDWACVPFRGAREGWQKALLIRRSLEKPDALTFYLTLAPEGTDLATLVQVAGSRWTIEACFEAAKGEVGLDEYEVRSWTGWHRHVTLALLAHAYLAVVRQHAIGGRGPRPRGRLAAPYGSRGAPAPLAS